MQTIIRKLKGRWQLGLTNTLTVTVVKPPSPVLVLHLYTFVYYCLHLNNIVFSKAKLAKAGGLFSFHISRDMQHDCPK